MTKLFDNIATNARFVKRPRLRTHKARASRLSREVSGKEVHRSAHNSHISQRYHSRCPIANLTARLMIRWMVRRLQICFWIGILLVAAGTGGGPTDKTISESCECV
jgi:ribosomal protein L35